MHLRNDALHQILSDGRAGAVVIATGILKMALNQRYAVDPENVFAKKVQDEIMLLDLNSGLYYFLNEVGAQIWEMLEQGHPLENILQALAESYEADVSVLEQDLRQLVADLTSQGLIQHIL